MRKLVLLVALALLGQPAHAAGVVVFDNPHRTTFPVPVPYFDDHPLIVYDDAHTTATGVLTGFDVWLWNNKNNPESDATIWIYTGDPNDGMPGPLLAGPYTIPVMPLVTMQFFHVDTPENPSLPTKDLWFAVTFT